MADPVWFDLAVRGIVGVLVLSILLICHGIWVDATTTRGDERSDRRDDSHTGLD